jgi:hypothetical protein
MLRIALSVRPNCVGDSLLFHLRMETKSFLKSAVFLENWVMDKVTK